MNLTFIFWLSALYTFALLGLQGFELWTGKAPFNFAAVNAVYMGLLSAYVGSKEVRRWAGGEATAVAQGDVVGGEKRPWRLPGEWFVGLWLVLLLAATFLVQARPERFHYPEGLNTIALEVLGFYLSTNVSRWLKSRDQKTKESLEKELDESPEGSGQAPASTTPRISAKRKRFEDLILAQIQKEGGITRESVEQITRLKTSAAAALISSMVTKGLLVRSGQSGDRQTRYTLP